MIAKGYCGLHLSVMDEWMDGLEAIVLASGADKDEWKSRYHWRKSRGRVQFDISPYSDETLKKIEAFLDAKGSDRVAVLAANALRQWMELKTDPDGQIVKKLENVTGVMKEFIIQKTEHHWVFEQEEDGNLVPWFVNLIEYEIPRDTPSFIRIELKALNGPSESKDLSTTNIKIFAGDILKRTMSQILADQGFYIETPVRYESYLKETEKYLQLCNRDGFQMSVSGKANALGGWSNTGFRTVEKSGRPAKMVINPLENEKEFQSSIPCSFWGEGDEKLWLLPVHPVLRMFDLDEHTNYRVHVNNTTPYVYDKDVGSKLVLLPDTKDFIEVLVEHSANAFTDIVSGKEGGTVVLLEGPPGTGKTLTAEVYSEVLERPLYRVHSSQLGVSPKALEEELQKVLRRAERWGAILLIDEADVFVHTRGSDIIQNAVVGVFLRVLEYYRGVLFMTTNRGTEIDDAIVSRFTARFEYQLPSKEDQARLWTILSKQNGIEISDEDVRTIVRKTPELSGRDIKNLLKLAYVASLKSGGKITPESVIRVLKFKQSRD